MPASPLGVMVSMKLQTKQQTAQLSQLRLMGYVG